MKRFVFGPIENIFHLSSAKQSYQMKSTALYMAQFILYLPLINKLSKTIVELTPGVSKDDFFIEADVSGGVKLF